SRRIEGEDREELKDALDQLDYPKGMSLIARTAGIGRSVAELQWDLNYMLKLWTAIDGASKGGKGAYLIYQESSLVIRAIRDYFTADIGEILIDTDDIYEQARQFMGYVMPDNVQRVKRYRDHTPLFTRFQIEHQIETAYSRLVPLPSGGAIVIDHTEALVAIDVNSARATRGSDIEETAFRTNLEAADEAARQMRLRDLGGLIVIDFIDMESSKNQREVEQRVKDALHYDRARVQAGKISRFGLMELSRQRLRPALNEGSHITCPRCNGTGVIRDIESSALHMLRVIQDEAMKESTAAVHAQVPVEVATYLLNEKRAEIAKLEARVKVEIVLIPNKYIETPHYKLERLRHDDERLATYRSSYSLADGPSDEGEYLEKKFEAVKPRQEAMVKGITPDQPAPVVAPKPAAEPIAPAPSAAPAAAPAAAARVAAPEPGGFFGRILGMFRRREATESPFERPVRAPAAPAATPATPAASTAAGRADEGARRGRDERRGGGRDERRGGRGRDERAAEGRGDRGEGRNGRGGERAAEPRAEGVEAREPRRGRGERRERPPRETAPVEAGASLVANGATAGLPGTEAVAETRTEEPRRRREPREPREAREPREGREPRAPRAERPPREERAPREERDALEAAQQPADAAAAPIEPRRAAPSPEAATVGAGEMNVGAQGEGPVPTADDAGRTDEVVLGADGLPVAGSDDEPRRRRRRRGGRGRSRTGADGTIEGGEADFGDPADGDSAVDAAVASGELVPVVSSPTPEPLVPAAEASPAPSPEARPSSAEAQRPVEAPARPAAVAEAPVRTSEAPAPVVEAPASAPVAAEPAPVQVAEPAPTRVAEPAPAPVAEPAPAKAVEPVAAAEPIAPRAAPSARPIDASSLQAVVEQAGLQWVQTAPSAASAEPEPQPVAPRAPRVRKPRAAPVSEPLVQIETQSERREG
ncbi:MAG TPA: Rne/Rng family ribonuclease, partial [Burkholderiaceae bacterium]|nr:Rne/Rng family ribonuclease [Burkholderiaceae bacterium]